MAEGLGGGQLPMSWQQGSAEHKQELGVGEINPCKIFAVI